MKRLLDLDGQARKHVAEGVLQRESDDDGADRRRRQKLLIEHEGRDDEKKPDDDGVLNNRRESIRSAPGPERIDGDQNDRVDRGEREEQPRNRLQVGLDARRHLSPRQDRAQREYSERQKEREPQPALDDAVGREAADGQRHREEDGAGQHVERDVGSSGHDELQQLAVLLE